MNSLERPSVLIVVENLPVPFDRRVWQEAKALKADGYEVSVICPLGKGHTARYEVLDGIRIYRHPLPRERTGALGYVVEYLAALYWEFRLSLRIQREQGFSVIHICNPPDVLFLVALWHKVLRGVRVIFDHHDLGPELYEEKFGRRNAFFHLLRLAERATMAVADVVISTNASYRRIALERGRKKPEDVFVVRSAPDKSFRRVAANPAYKRGRKYLVGYLGVMAEQDGVDTVLQVCHEIVHRRGRQDVAFMLIGGGPSEQALKSLCDELELSPYVEFAGFQTGEELLARLSTFDVGVGPDPVTPYNTLCTMNKVMEYMALGLPVVQFDLVEGRASAGGASLYAAAGDLSAMASHILLLLDDPAMRDDLATIGRSRMERSLSWEHQVPHLLAAYEEASGR